MASAEAPIDGEQPVQKLEGEELETALRQQLEYYFSKENLARDSFLISKMNSQRFVPIDVIANFRKVKQLTEDVELLVRIMKGCKNLVLDEASAMVRPNIKMERTTLILRGIPVSTPKEEIMTLFEDSENCGKVVSLKPDVDDNWFVSFESEDDCVKTKLFLTGKKFQGKLVQCGVKSEHLSRGLYSAAPPGAVPAPFFSGQQQEGGFPAGGAARWRQGPPPAGGYHGGYYGGGYMGGYGAQYYKGKDGAAPAATAADGKPAPAPAAAAATTSGAGQQGQGQRRERRESGATGRKPRRVTDSPPSDAQPTSRGARTGSAAAGKPARGGSKAAAADAAKVPGSPEADHFPALAAGAPAAAVAAAAAAAGSASAAAGDKKKVVAVPLPLGYTKPYIRYSREDLVSLIDKLCARGPDVLPKPDSIPAAPKPGAVAAPEDSGCPVARAMPLQRTQLHDPFPVMFPASPSPLQMAQQAQQPVPFFSLDTDPLLDPTGALAGVGAFVPPVVTLGTGSHTGTHTPAPGSASGSPNLKSSTLGLPRPGQPRAQPKYAQKPAKPAAAAGAPATVAAAVAPAPATDAAPAVEAERAPAAKKAQPKYAPKAAKPAPAASGEAVAPAPAAATAAAASSAPAPALSKSFAEIAKETQNLEVQASARVLSARQAEAKAKQDAAKKATATAATTATPAAAGAAAAAGGEKSGKSEKKEKGQRGDKDKDKRPRSSRSRGGDKEKEKDGAAKPKREGGRRKGGQQQHATAQTAGAAAAAEAKESTEVEDPNAPKKPSYAEVMKRALTGAPAPAAAPAAAATPASPTPAATQP